MERRHEQTLNSYCSFRGITCPHRLCRRACSTEQSTTSSSTVSPSVPNSSGATVSTSQSDTHTAVGIPSTPTLRTFQNLDLNLYEEGYDSDGQIGPHFDANIAEGPQIYDEDEIDEIMTAIPTEDDTPDEFVMIASEDILKLKVAELKVEIEKRGLVCSGLKKNLQEILKKAMIDRTPISNAAVRTTITSPVIPRGFAVTAHWVPLTAEDDVVPEPVDNPEFFCAPTIPENERNCSVPLKHNFQEAFDRPEFTGKVK